MWLMTSILHDLTTGSWISRLCFGVLLVSSLFSLGSLGGFSIQTIATKWTTSTAPMTNSGSDYGRSMTFSSDSKLNWSKPGSTSTIRKFASEPSNIAAKDGKP
jgi:hypothetical protein